MYIDTRPLEEAFLKRRAQFSTVIVFKCRDPKRLEPLLLFVESYYRERCSKRNKSYRILLYKVWGGLFEVTVVIEADKTKINHMPVMLSATGSSALLQAIAQSAGTVRSLDVAISYVDSLMQSEENICFVIYGLFERDNNLIAFLRNAIFTENYYAKHHTIVLMLDDPLAVLDEETLRYCIYIEIPPSTDQERETLVRNILQELREQIRGEVNIREIVEVTRGLTLHETESILLESIFRYRALRPDVIARYKNEIVRKSGVVDIEESQYGFEAIGGYNTLKQFIVNNIVKVLKNPERAQRLGVRPPRGILLFGPPGTGKTLFARALAKELNLPFLRLRTERIVSELYGRTERNLARVIEIAESIAPCVLFIDEVDRFGRRSTIDTDSGTTRRAFSILLEWLGDERRRTIVVATTNVPEMLDEAFIRVGRFDYIIPVLYPDYEARTDILRVHTQIRRKVPLAEDVDLSRIAKMTELWTGAELEELVLRACRLALQEDSDTVTMKHFENALRTFRIDLEGRKRQLERYISLAEKYCNDAKFIECLKREYERERSRLELLKDELGF